MNWRSITFTLTAMWLITLPFHSIANECDEQSWNRALTQQRLLDDAYNGHALRFNEFLPVHLTQPFLHEEFSFTEITSFWHREKTHLQEKMLEQIAAAEEVILRIETERKAVVSLLVPALYQAERWSAIYQDCRIKEAQENEANSQRFLLESQELHSQLLGLLSQLNVLRLRYELEVDTLQRAHEAARM